MPWKSNWNVEPLPLVSAPVIASRSDVALLLLSSNNAVAAPAEPFHVTLPPTLKVPMLVPGASSAPVCAVTLPAIVPVPPSVAPLATVTALDAWSEPFTCSVPAFTVVAPV